MDTEQPSSRGYTKGNPNNTKMTEDRRLTDDSDLVGSPGRGFGSALIGAQICVALSGSHAVRSCVLCVVRCVWRVHMINEVIYRK
jgi:hypothetical protein